MTTDRQEIDAIVAKLFALFDNRGGRVPELERLHELCGSRAVISKCVETSPEVATVAEFIRPRQALLTNGTLTEFHEWETSAHTVILGNVAQRLCTYAKSGVRDGVPFSALGAKTIQLVKTAEGWRIAAVAWDDEREGFMPPRAVGDERQTIFPILRYDDTRAAIRWLCDAFGFELLFAAPETGPAVRHAQLRLGTNIVMVGSVRPDDGIRSPLAAGVATQALCVHVSDVDVVYRRAVAAGAAIAEAPRTNDLGFHEFHARDIEGHPWTFTSYLPGRTD